jgi:hypothetical protein
MNENLKRSQLKTFFLKVLEGWNLVQMKVELELHMMRVSNTKIAVWLSNWLTIYMSMIWGSVSFLNFLKFDSKFLRNNFINTHLTSNDIISSIYSYYFVSVYLRSFFVTCQDIAYQTWFFLLLSWNSQLTISKTSWNSATFFFVSHDLQTGQIT